MARRIPPLNPLRAFEVVARTGSLTAAAAELHVTQSAVSRHVAALEDYVGQPLFVRERYGVRLTPAGAAYAKDVVPAFAAIAAATEKLTRGGRRTEVRLHTYTTFAAKWLLPRLEAFRELNPGIELKLSNGPHPVNLDRDGLDLAIQMGDGNWPHAKADFLFADEIEPVCSPAYLERYAPPPTPPTALLHQRLLVGHYRRADWDDWLQATGLAAEAKNAEHMQLNYSMLTWQAAVDGLGLAIGQIRLLGPDLAAGRLVRPFQHPVTRERGYYLLRRAQPRESRKVAAFRDWLLGLPEVAGGG